MKKLRMLTFLLTIVLTAGVFCGCKTSNETETSKEPDYSNDEFWVSKPETAEYEADTFFILPTVNLKNTTPGNETLVSEEDNIRFVKTLAMESQIMANLTNIYSPYYRQATMGCYLDSDGIVDYEVSGSEEMKEYMDLAYSDIREAWIYYIENCNEKRPVVLFGYSQGAEMILKLLAEFGDDSEYSDMIVASYVIGMPVTEDYLKANPKLKMAEGEDDTGVIISFNAYDERANLAGQKEYSINPLNWTTDGAVAAKSTNKGYVVTDTDGNITEEIPCYCGAYIDTETGKLIVTDIEGQDELYNSSGLFAAGDYHLYDLMFFHRNLEENIEKRINKKI
ncbi:MAG: DUF3089 domain-containing protein [Lachnospiraceae bacterium]|nr:DUF3089 domain-containing protein [Lachnospiraceae bacterium]